MRLLRTTSFSNRPCLFRLNIFHWEKIHLWAYIFLFAFRHVSDKADIVETREINSIYLSIGVSLTGFDRYIVLGQLIHKLSFA